MAVNSASLRQQAAGVEHRLGAGLEAVAHAHHERAERRRGQRPVREQVVQERDVAGVEQLDLGLDPGRGDDPGHPPHVARRVDHDLAAGVHGVEVEGADLGLERRDVLDAALGRQEGRAGAGDLGVVLRGDEAAAGAGREVEDQPRVLGADALDDLAVELERHRGLARPGSRTWRWTTAAPASAAPSADSAISSGVIGRWGVWSGVVRLPVTAQVTTTLARGGRIAAVPYRARPPSTWIVCPVE